MDFGKILSDEAFGKGQLMKTLAGTIHYMAPEFFEHIETGKPLQYGPIIDVFSLGLVFQTILLYSPQDAEMVPRLGKYKVLNLLAKLISYLGCTGITFL